MDALPKDIEALLLELLAKVFITIDALTPECDVPVITEYMALRLAFLVYAMDIWRQMQIPNIQGKPQSLRLSKDSKPAYPSGLAYFSDSPVKWQFLLEAKAVRSRYGGGLGVWELAAAPAQESIRKTFESLLGTLLEDLIASNTVKKGTWQEVRLLDDLLDDIFSPRGVVTPADFRAVDILDIVDFIENGNSTACRFVSSAYEFVLRALLQGWTEAALPLDFSGKSPLANCQSNDSTMAIWLDQSISVNSTESPWRKIVWLDQSISMNSKESLWGKIVVRRLSIPEIPFQASVFHLPTHFRRKALLHSIVPAHYRALQDAGTFKIMEHYVWGLPKQIASGHVSSEGFDEGWNQLLFWAYVWGNKDACRLLLQCGADVNVDFRQSERWLHLINNLRSQRSMYAKLPRLDRSLVPSRNSISISKDGGEGTNAEIKKDHRAAVTRLRGNGTIDGKSRSGSSETQSGAPDSLSTLGFILRVRHDATSLFGFWKHLIFGVRVRRNFNRLLRPRVPQDHVRLTWICHCGKELYGDFHNGDPSAVVRLADRLQKRTQGIDRCSTATLLPATGHTNQTVTQPSYSSSSSSLASGSSGTPSAPAGSSASSSQALQTSRSQVQPPQPCHLKTSGSTSSQSSGGPGLVATGYSPVPSTTYAPMQKQYVEMCVNTGRHYQRLAEIDVAIYTTDAQLFGWIRKRYGELRGWRTKWQYFLRPQAMSYVEFALDRKQKVHIYQSKDAYPPKAEIDAGRYMYNMPPPPIPSNTFIHYLRECDLDSYSGSQDNEILEIIAKKLDTRVSDHPSLSAKAYGMLVHEGLDVTAILWTMTIMVVVLCGPLIAFVVITKDVQSATGLAAAALAVVTLLWMGMQVDRGMNFSD